MKFKVFISGNQRELQEERIAVKEVILNTSIIRDFFEPFLFEDLPAGGRDAVSTYLNEVKSSDIYIGILGNSYGQKNENGISATELEYHTFLENVNDGEILLFIKCHDDSLRDSATNEFFNKAKKLSVYKRFNSIKGLKNQVIRSLEAFLISEGRISFEEFDDRINPEIGYDAIDENEVKDFLRKRAINMDLKVPNIPIINILDSLEVLKEHKGHLIPNNTAILFFSQKASDYFPQNEIRIARFDGITRGTPTIDSQEIKGPVYQIIDQVENFFRRNTRTASKIVDFKRVDIPEYPYSAIREALINAIAHRDYNRTGAPILFYIYDDKVEVISPGGLVSGVTLKNIGSKHEARNRNICRIFHKTKDMEQLGTGIHKMRDDMRDYGLSEPEFRLYDKSFAVIFHGPGEYILDLVSSIPEDRKTDLKDLGLNDRQIKALEIMVNDGKIFTSAMYQEIFNVSRRTATRDFKKLLELKMIQKSGDRKSTTYKAI
jgi:ATP-dependent DNA helicase RecG